MIEQIKREQLEAEGWKIGTVAEFLQLTPEESTLIEIKLALSKGLKERRQQQMTQVELATKIKSSQPRIARAESGDNSVSMELIMKAMLALGVTPKEIAGIIETVDLPVAT